MKKKIVALLAAIAAVLGFGFATGTAMADPYGQPGVVEGNSVSFTFQGLTPNGEVTVTADDAVVSDIVPVISRKFNADKNGTLTVKFILKDGVAAGTVVKATAVDKKTGKTVTLEATVPSTGAGNQVPQTGASVAPYAVAVVLLAAAGCAVFAARKAGAR
ncbi:hypothetical protein [Bifidobacterium pullorum]|uniref:hypothetical protein n=1 Tax=Bifidobacterium pullorum TaxID=78448 RepID=UPI003AF80895